MPARRPRTRYTRPMRWLSVLLCWIVLVPGVMACGRAPGVAAWMHDDDLFDVAAAVLAVRIVRTEAAQVEWRDVRFR